MMEEASIVTVTAAVEGGVAFVNGGAINVFGFQSFRKKPMVFSTAGSETGVTELVSVGPPVTGGGAVLFAFLQEKKNIITGKMITNLTGMVLLNGMRVIL